MENVLLGVAVALFIIGAALAVVAGVMFVKWVCGPSCRAAFGPCPS